MPSSFTQYGAYSPQALDPSSVENTLAGQVGASDPAAANILLNTYQAQRQSAQGNYDYALQQQHDYAREALQQQLYEANLKGLAEAKDPTVLQLMASSPTYSSSVLSGIDRNALSDLVSRARYGQDVTNLEHLGQGANALAQGGYQFKDPNSIPGLGTIGGGVTNLGPASVQAAEKNAAGRIAAAQIRAAGTGSDPHETMTITDPRTGIPKSVTKPKNWSDDQWYGWLRAQGVQLVDQPPANAPPPSASGAQSQAPQPQAPQPQVSNRRVPNLPMARQDTPANTQAGAAAARQQVLSRLDIIQRTHPDVYADIKKRMAQNNGVPDVTPNGRGGWLVKGASGNAY